MLPKEGARVNGQGHGGGRRLRRAQGDGEHTQIRAAQYVTKLGDEEVFVRLIVSLTARGAGFEPREARS